ncbi:MAG: CHC2 zinc finger domain-containing protein [Methylococcaceae bacterium]
MARLSDNEITKLKNEVSLHDLVESSSITLKKQGKDYLGHCPFHDDKTPSLVISPDKNLWNCLGACSEGGDVIQWVMKREGLSFRDAVAWLIDDSKTVVAKSGSQSTPSKIDPQSLTSLAANPDDQALLGQILDYFNATLKQSPKALDYLASRGLVHPELIDTFQLGFADFSLSQRLPQGKFKAGAEVRDQLKRIGILRASTGQGHFTGSLVIPVLNPEGVIGEVYGRRIAVSTKTTRPNHLYLRGVFNESALAVSSVEEIILCESLIDALTFWVAGFRHVTASYGASGFTDDHLMAFKKYGIKRVLIAYDRDEAGNKATDKLAMLLMAEGIDCFRVLFPKDMDANSFAVQGCTSISGGRKPGETALENKLAEKSLELVLRSAQWMGKGKQPEIAAKQEKENKEQEKVKTKPESEKNPESKFKPETEKKFIPSLAAGSCSSSVYQQVELFEGAEPIQASP